MAWHEMDRRWERGTKGSDVHVGIYMHIEVCMVIEGFNESGQMLRVTIGRNEVSQTHFCCLGTG